MELQLPDVSTATDIRKGTFTHSINPRFHRPKLYYPATLPAKVMSRATRAKRGRGASAAGRMPGRIIHWDLEAELNQLEEQGELQQEAGLQQADQQNQSMPWDANREEWQLPPPSARRQPVSQQLRPVPRQGTSN